MRPLYDDGAARRRTATRDYVLELDARDGEPPLLSIFGGKITTYRRLAEEALNGFADFFSMTAAPWTRGADPAGRRLAMDDRNRLVSDLDAIIPGLGAATARRLARTYGTVARDILGRAARAEDLGVHFGAGLHQREVEHLVDNGDGR